LTKTIRYRPERLALGKPAWGEFVFLFEQLEVEQEQKKAARQTKRTTVDWLIWLEVRAFDFLRRRRTRYMPDRLAEFIAWVQTQPGPEIKTGDAPARLVLDPGHVMNVVVDAAATPKTKELFGRLASLQDEIITLERANVTVRCLKCGGTDLTELFVSERGSDHGAMAAAFGYVFRCPAGHDLISEYYLIS